MMKVGIYARVWGFRLNKKNKGHRFVRNGALNSTCFDSYCS
jgi:hypothetical protein